MAVRVVNRFNGGPDNCPAIRAPRCRSCEDAIRNGLLQWRAGQLPGHTNWRSSRWSFVLNASMEGRTIARPYRPRDRHRDRSGTMRASMEGRTIARPYPVADATSSDEILLQWRAGQLPGHTPDRGGGCPADEPSASMEGRTIARPYGTTAAWATCWPAMASMEGRTIARPYRSCGAETAAMYAVLQWRAGQLPGHTSSAMSCTPTTRCRFNGGPDNCPAILSVHMAVHHRAHQPTSSFNGGPDNCPAIHKGTHIRCTRPGASMEGRTIARPYRAPCVAHHPAGGAQASMEGRTIARPYKSPNSRPGHDNNGAFNGGPDNCPAILVRESIARTTVSTWLQWRAGQLPGHTGPLSYAARRGLGQASMEGRTIARPYPSMRYRTTCMSSNAFNGGPDNCPAIQAIATWVGLGS